MLFEEEKGVQMLKYRPQLKEMQMELKFCLYILSEFYDKIRINEVLVYASQIQTGE